MRLLLWLGVAVAFVAGVPASSAGTQRHAPVAIAFWDAGHGLAAQTSFESCSRSSPAERVRLERTSDGGRTWATVVSTCASITGVGGEVTIATVAPETALLSVPGGLLLTRDRGRSWSRLTAPRVVALSFSSAADGWSVVAQERTLSVQSTDDGGRTWKRLGAPCRGDDAKVSFVGEAHGWLLCLWAAGVGNQGKAVYETRDGGASWQLRARAPFAVRAVGKLSTYGYPTDVVFRHAGRGWMPQVRGATLTTRDGGHTWSQLGITVPEVKLGLSVSFVSDATGFMLVQNGYHRRYELDRTADGGRTWHVVHTWAS
jgi:photosystem II stability/assembly factor-like uncharacterized protein